MSFSRTYWQQDHVRAALPATVPDEQRKSPDDEVQLPTVTRVRFIAAGLLFLGGALGFEMLSAIAADRSGYESVSYTLLYSAEELLEMLGIVLFLYALLSHLAEETGGVILRLTPVTAEPVGR